jgi:TolB-like protein/tetratricopeptide (TPR) repeat protein
MAIWSAEIKELEKLYESFKGQLPDLEKELERLVKSDDENMVLLYSRRCLEVIITDLCECELNRPRKTEPLKGIIDKLHKEGKVPPNIISSMHGLNELSTYGTHPKDFDPEQVKPVLINLDIIIKWYLKYKETGTDIKQKLVEEVHQDSKVTEDAKKSFTIPKRRLVGLLSGLIMLIVVVVAALYFSKIISGGKQTKETEKSIAVIPFVSMSDDPEKQYLADAMMDAILLHLSKIEDLRVMSRTSVEQYRKTKKTTNTICKELDVTYLLEGSFQKYGDNARLIVQLIKAGKEGHLWANDYTRNWKDIFAVQSEVAQTIARELRVVISPEEKQLIEKVPTVNLTALDFYQRGREEIVNYWLDISNKAALENAENLYQKALDYDSKYALAYSGLAMLELMKYDIWSENIVGTDYFTSTYLDSAKILSDLALTYDANLAEAYYVKGLYYWHTGKEEKVLENIDKALEYNPNDWMVYNFNGFYYYIYSKQDQDYVKAINNLKKAINLNHGRELPGLLNSLGVVYSLMAGFPEEGEKFFNQALTLNGDSAEYFNALGLVESNYNGFDKSIEYYTRAIKIDSTEGEFVDLGIVYAYSGRYKESLKYINKYAEWLKENHIVSEGKSHRIAYAYYKNGNKKEADYWFNEQKRYCEESINNKRFSGQISLTSYYDLACVYAFRGEKQKAYENLKVLGQLKIFPKWWLDLIKRDPLLENLRGEPEFRRIVDDIETKYQAEHERVRKWLEEQGML